jgi:hypothetical protein
LIDLIKEIKMAGLIVYRGVSAYDGKPIAVVLVKPEGKSNIKTGAVIQQYIIRENIDPVSASRIGEDYSICGNCKHRGKANPDKGSGVADNRSCYVLLFQGPAQVYKAVQSGKYPEATTIQQVQDLSLIHI